MVNVKKRKEKKKKGITKFHATTASEHKFRNTGIEN